MSYYATFKPSQEAIDTLRGKDPFSYKKEDESDALKKEMELELLTLCMKGTEDNIHSVIFNISTRLQVLRNITIHKCIQSACKQFENEKQIQYCGWDKASRTCDWTDVEIIDRTLENLLMYTLIVPTKDFYKHDEKDYFYEKWNNVKDEITEFSEFIYDWYIFEIMESLVDYRTGEDIGDKTWWKQPEKQEENNGD
jgi:hypothetical protein